MTASARLFSADGASPGRRVPIPYRPGPDSRFFIRRLASGDLVLVYHDDPRARRRLTAWISRDEGASWQGGLLIDERDGVSYPDGQQDADGRLHLIHDFDRYGQRQICYSCVTPEEILAGRLSRPDSFSRPGDRPADRLRSLLPGTGRKPRNPRKGSIYYETMTIP